MVFSTLDGLRSARGVERCRCRGIYRGYLEVRSIFTWDRAVRSTQLCLLKRRPTKFESFDHKRLPRYLRFALMVRVEGRLSLKDHARLHVGDYFGRLVRRKMFDSETIVAE
jgi:hypothetical protein